ncbi:MAG: VCBS repeat-containing protein, partial [Bacteroidales bacterium]|nr:VCBS repeat-containing protein [Bacteroidales bacterium]
MTAKRFLLLTFLSLIVYTGTAQNFFTDENIIYYSDIVVPASVFVCDIDTDGDEDVLAAFFNEIVLYENNDGKGTFSEGSVIFNLAGEATSIHAADIDGDGDPDILASIVNEDKIAWFENTDGQGSFGPQQVISSQVDRPWSLFASDLDTDGDLDVLSTSVFDEKIAWYENTDGAGNFGQQQVISSLVAWPNAVRTADLNMNGHQDVLFVSGSYNDSRVNWIEHNDGQGNFDSPKMISEMANGAKFVDAV